MDCESVHALLPAYSVGATDPQETELVRAHLAICPEAQSELASYARLSEGLLYSAPLREPSPHLAARLKAATSATAQPQQSAEHAAPTPWWHRLRVALLPQGLQPVHGLAIAAIAVLLVMSLFWITQLSSLQASQDQLAARLDAQSDLLAMVGEGSFLRIEIPAGPAGEATGAYATLVCNPDREVGFLYAEDLPELPTGHAYQVWLIQGEVRTSGGLFQANSQGEGTILIQAPVPMGQIDALGITVEPAGGSDGPTTPPVVRGFLYENYEQS